MIGSILESLFLGLVLLAGLVCVAVLTGGFLLWRYGRRKLRAFRSHGAVIGATALWDAAASNRWNRSAAVVTSAELEQWSSARVAKEMWRSVDRATAAVRAADELGGPDRRTAVAVPAPPGRSRRHRQGAAGRSRGTGTHRRWATRCSRSCGRPPTSSRPRWPRPVRRAASGSAT